MNKTAVAQQTKTASFLSHAQGMLQRKCACGNHTVAGGKCADCAKKKGMLQRKLSICASNDPLEHEADRIAEQVMAMPLNLKVNPTLPSIQRFSGQATNESLETAPLSVDRVLSSPGAPLEPIVRQDMEARFGHDFSQVRVHTDAFAEQSAHEVRSAAYTVGRHVVFGSGRYAPHTPDGKRLLVHELSHTLQQGGAGVGILSRAPRTVAEIDAEIRDVGVLRAEAEANARTLLDLHGRPLQGSLLRRGLEDMMGDERLPNWTRQQAQQALAELEQWDGVSDRLHRERESVAPTKYSAPKQDIKSQPKAPSPPNDSPKVKATPVTKTPTVSAAPASKPPLTTSKPPTRTVSGQMTVPQKGGQTSQTRQPGTFGALAGGLVSLVTVFGTFYLQRLVREHLAPKFEEGARQLVTQAIEAHRLQFYALINSHRKEVEEARVAGHPAAVHGTVAYELVSTQFGIAMTKAEVVGRATRLVFEGGHIEVEGPLWREGIGTLGTMAKKPQRWFGSLNFAIPLEALAPDVPKR